VEILSPELKNIAFSMSVIFEDVKYKTLKIVISMEIFVIWTKVADSVKLLSKVTIVAILCNVIVGWVEKVGKNKCRL